MARLSAHSLPGLPEVREGDDVAALIAAAASTAAGETGGSHGYQPIPGLRDGQLVAIAHKIVSKAEGAVVRLADVHPSPRAVELGTRTGKHPQAVQVVLDNSAEIVRAERGVIVARTPHGFVCANAGVDASNASEPETLVTLPADPDASARRIRARLRELTDARVGVLVTDSFGRAWRHGQCDVALGCAGLAPMDDWRGRTDAAGRELRATWLAVADAVAAAAELARAKDSREPVVVFEGLERFLTEKDGPGAAALVRPLEEDLFR